MGRKAAKISVFLCLMLMISISLSGCAILGALINIITGIAGNIGGMLGNIAQIAAPAMQAIQGVTNAIGTVQGAAGQNQAQNPPALMKVTPNPDDEDEAAPAAQVKAAATPEPAKPAVTAGAVTVVDENRAGAAMAKADAAVVTIDQRLADLQGLAQVEMPAEARQKLDTVMSDMRQLKEFIGQAKGDGAGSASEVDRLEKNLNEAGKFFDELNGRAQALVSGVQAVAGTAVDFLKKAGSLFGSLGATAGAN